ncbi:tripartite tricarboxylate transporter substrate-binding protein [Variovorax boronicumulans]
MSGLSRRKRAALALAAVSGTLARAAHAQRDFPSRPIRWIVPYPAGTPTELVARLQQAVTSAIHNPAVLRKLAESGVEPVGSTPAQFEALVGDETARWHPLIKDLGLLLD